MTLRAPVQCNQGQAKHPTPYDSIEPYPVVFHESHGFRPNPGDRFVFDLNFPPFCLQLITLSHIGGILNVKWVRDAVCG